ncbi:MAG: pyridoxal phosphate-dependent aminotransferase [Oscillospiraceae bacterium]|nr:pyridoxal phosphate-dependent aminotransferase [Oscillospiraceae bacterium]
MLPEKSLAWGRTKSCIRELAAYCGRRKAEIGAENVFDFSLGNPSVPAPPCVAEAMEEALRLDSASLHGYTPAAGLPGFRRAIAEDLNARFGAGVSADMIYVTCGAAAGLAACMHGLLLPGEELVAFAPFFPEYRVFAESAGGALVTVPPLPDMQPDLDALERAVGEKTRAVIVNTPNNPSGAVLPAASLRRLGDILRAAEAKYGRAIYLISDEPYRELVYDGAPADCVFKYYDDAIICYSFSKSLSLPGERVGYLAVGSAMADGQDVFDAISGAARGCGYVNAPSSMQRVIEKCLGRTADISVYRRNRDLLYSGLTALGFDCVHPGGAFYLFMRSPEADAKAFSERAKKYELALVPSDDFGIEGYVRLAYCVPEEMIRRSLPAFAALARDYRLGI